jgi:hypothetical protein
LSQDRQAVLKAVFAAAVAVTSVAATATPLSQSARVEVERQDRDDDCGAAVLAMLLRSAGYEVSERELERAAGRLSGGVARGLSMADLQRMVAATASDLTLAGEWMNERALIERVVATPVIALLYEQGGRRGAETAALGHYVLLEGWSPSRGFLASDPAIGRRGFIASRELFSSAHQRNQGGARQILILHLRRAGYPLPRGIPVAEQEERSLRDITELRRLPAGLAPGQAVLNLTLRHGSLRERSPGEEQIALRSRSASAGIILQYGLADRQALSLSVDWGRASGTIQVPGGPAFSYRDAAIGPIQVGYMRQFNLPGRENVSASLSAAVAFSREGIPAGATFGLTAQAQHRRTSLIGALDFSLAPARHDLGAAAAVSVGIARDLGGRVNIGVALSARLPSEGRVESSILFFGSVRISNSMEFGIYASQGIARPHGSSAREFGLTLTRILPNFFR